jgi:hypothetical protein
MTEHVIMYRQKSLSGSSADLYPFQQQAVCSCSWESDWHVVANEVEFECDNHMHDVWLALKQPEPKLDTWPNGPI